MAAKNYRTLFWFIYIRIKILCFHAVINSPVHSHLYCTIPIPLLDMFYIESEWHKAIEEGRGHCIRYLHFKFYSILWSLLSRGMHRFPVQFSPSPL